MKARKTGSRIRLQQRHRTRQRFRVSMKQVLWTSSALVILLAAGIFLFINVSDVRKVYAAASGDYRSKATGAWSSTSTWERFNGTSWIAATVAPTSTDGVIEILSGHTVSITANVTVDQVVVDAGGSLTVNSGKTLTLANGTGTDMDINGTVTANGTFSQSNSAAMDIAGLFVDGTGSHNFGSGCTVTIKNGGRYRQDGGAGSNGGSLWTINSGGTYQHNMNGNNIPQATWNTGSLCEITGVTTTQPGNLDQSFSNFTWNCASQTSKESFSSALTTINGDFTLTSTGSGGIRLAAASDDTLNIGGSFVQTGGTIYLSGAADWIMNVAGNYTQSSGSFIYTDATSGNGAGNPIVNVTGNFTFSGGTFDMNQYTGHTSGKGIGTLNLFGNFTMSGGTLKETASSTGYGDIYFKKSGPQIFSKTSGTISNTINFTVNSSSILDMGNSVVDGAGDFTMSSGAGILVSSSSGITSSSSSGNIQVSGSRSFSTNANYTFQGTSAQVTGSGFPSTVNNLTINNSAGVTLTNDLNVSGILTFSSGKITTGSKEVNVTNAATSSVTGYSSSSYVVGDLRRSVNASGSYDFPVGTSSNYEMINITLSGISGFTNILGSFTNSNPVLSLLPLSNINVLGTSITDVLDYGYWSLTPNNTISGGSYSVTLNEKGQSNTAALASQHCVVKRSSIWSSWQSLGTHVNTTQSITNGIVSATRSGLTSFSHYAVGRGGNSFPIELIYFNADLNGDEVELKWATAAELNNDYFTVERSTDGTHFTELLRKPGAGNSTVKLYYADSDKEPVGGYTYYRLKQTDYDGHFTYSDIKTVKYNSKEKQDEGLTITSIHPNPFSEKFNVSFMLKATTTVDVQLYNLSGQVVFKDVINTSDGMNQYDFIDQQGLPSGIYFLTLLYEDKKITQKIIKN